METWIWFSGVEWLQLLKALSTEPVWAGETPTSTAMWARDITWFSSFHVYIKSCVIHMANSFIPIHVNLWTLFSLLGKCSEPLSNSLYYVFFSVTEICEFLMLFIHLPISDMQCINISSIPCVIFRIISLLCSKELTDAISLIFSFAIYVMWI